MSRPRDKLGERSERAAGDHIEFPLGDLLDAGVQRSNVAGADGPGGLEDERRLLPDPA